jgi:hypothetical protein
MGFIAFILDLLIGLSHHGVSIIGYSSELAGIVKNVVVFEYR